MSDHMSKAPLHLIKGNRMAVLDAGSQELLDRNGEPGDDYDAYLRRLRPEQGISPAEAGVDVEIVNLLPVGSRSGALRIIRPAGANGALPLLLYFHGSHWRQGEPHSHDRFLYEICRGAQVAVACVDDALADGTPLAEQLEISEQAIAFLMRDGGLASDDRLLIGGDGAGGYLAMALSLAWGRQHRPTPRLVLLICPLMGRDEETSSRQQFADGPWLTSGIVKEMVEQRLGLPIEYDDAAMPFGRGSRQLANSPPAVIMTAENDPLRDEAEAYGRQLMRAGVDVSVTRYIGTIHNFPIVDALADTAAARAALNHIIHACKALALQSC